MFKKLNAFFNKLEYVEENLTEDELLERLKKSDPYEDDLLKDEKRNNANLFVETDGKTTTAILIDRKTGRIPRAWRNYDIDRNVILEYKKKHGLLEAEKPEAPVVARPEPVSAKAPLVAKVVAEESMIHPN